MQYKGQARYRRNQHPAEHGDEKTILDIELVMPPEKPPQRASEQNGDNSGNKEGQQVASKARKQEESKGE